MAYGRYGNILPFETAVRNGQWPEHFFVTKFGREDSIAAGDTEVWSTGGAYPYLQIPSFIDLVSTQATDSSASTGARFVQVEGLDANWNRQSEVFEMNGTSTVQGTKEFIRVFRMFVTEVGFYGNTNDGLITATHRGFGTTAATIVANRGQTEMCLWSVPAGHTAFILRFDGSVKPGNNEANLYLRTRENADVISPSTPIGAWRRKWSILAVTNQVTRNYVGGLRVSEKTDIAITAEESGTGSAPDVEAELDILVIPNYPDNGELTHA